MSNNNVQTHSFPSSTGRTVRLWNGPITDKTLRLEGSVAEDAVLVSLYVASVSVSLEVKIYTEVNGHSLLAASFPLIVAPTTSLVLKKAANIMTAVRIECVVVGTADFEVYAKGTSSAESSVRVLGAANARASQADCLTTPTLLVASALADRSGMVIKNWSPSGGPIMYIGFSAAEVAISNGYPLAAGGESLGLDVTAGVEIWGLAVGGTADVRMLESGG